MSIFTNWTDEHAEKFQHEIMTVNHKLEASGLFTDAALVDMLDSHPDDMLDVCTMGEHKLYPNKFRTGDFRDCDGKTLVELVKKGKLWINARRAMNTHQEYRVLLDQMYGELAKKTGNREFNANGGILISSPVARVPYHADRQQTVLWHIRGTKRLYIYPMTQKFISDESYEAAATSTLADDIPYEDAFDDSATILKLTGGEMAAWKLNQPHKVVNETFCVSVTTEYSNRTSAIKNSAMYTQATLRSKFGASPIWDESPASVKLAKSLVGKVLKKSGVYRTRQTPDYVTFKVDPFAQDCIIDIEPVVRDF